MHVQVSTCKCVGSEVEIWDNYENEIRITTDVYS